MGLLGSNHPKEQMVVAGRIDGTGTASITSGSGFSFADGGSGTYTVTFDRAYDTLIAVVAQSLTADINVAVGTITHTDGTDGPSIVFQGNAEADGTDTDCDFSFITVWETDT